MIGERSALFRKRLEAFMLRFNIRPWMFIVAAMALFVYLGWQERVPLLPIKSADFRNALNKWYYFIRDHGFWAFGEHFYNYTYTPTYPYTFWIAQKIFPNASSLHAIKVISFLFDIFAATMAWALVRLQRSEPWPTLAFGAVMFCPTVILNGAAWGQCDVIYTAFILAFLYAVLRERMLLACVLFGLGFAVKLQTGFLGPVLLLLFVRRQIPAKYLAVVPAVYVLMMLPACLAGRPMLDLLMIYKNQFGAYQIVSYDAPNMFQFFNLSYNQATLVGLGTAAIFSAALCAFGARAQFFLEGKNIIVIALISAVMMPFTLPRMMYRYFFAADLISIVFAFYFPRLFFVPILIQFASLYSYPRFVPMKWFPFSYLSFANFAALLVLLGLLVSLSGHVPRFVWPFRRKTAPSAPLA